MLKILVVVFLAILIFLQYRLWVENNGIKTTLKLEKAIAVQAKQNQLIEKKNQALEAEVNNLKHGNQSIEETAREELGMIKKGEQFYQIVAPPVKKH